MDVDFKNYKFLEPDPMERYKNRRAFGLQVEQHTLRGNGDTVFLSLWFIPEEPEMIVLPCCPDNKDKLFVTYPEYCLYRSYTIGALNKIQMWRHKREYMDISARLKAFLNRCGYSKNREYLEAMEKYLAPADSLKQDLERKYFKNRGFELKRVMFNIDTERMQAHLPSAYNTPNDFLIKNGLSTPYSGGNDGLSGK